MSSGRLAEVRNQAELRRRLHVYEVLETARRQLCTYAGDPCDCKYGMERVLRPASESTGCPELRDLIKEWTGWRPFRRGQSVEDDLRRFEEEARRE